MGLENTKEKADYRDVQIWVSRFRTEKGRGYVRLGLFSSALILPLSWTDAHPMVMWFVIIVAVYSFYKAAKWL